MGEKNDITNILGATWIGGLFIFITGMVLEMVNPVFSDLWCLGTAMFIAGIGMIFGAMGYYIGYERAIENDT